jgi:hypothetical protein
MLPECSVEFGAVLPRPTPPYEELWVKVEFELAAFASARPHRDDEDLADVSGYDIVPRRRDERSGLRGYRNDAEWLRTGVCPDPSFYFSTDSTWLEAERQSWSERQRSGRPSEDAVHFLLDGRDGYVEVLASGFTWDAWPEGHPRQNLVPGAPIRRGRWTDAGALPA